MPPSKASRKRQARLVFTPLDSSSPAVKQYNKQIQERAAAVGYDGSPSPAKRRKLRQPEDIDSSLGGAQMDGVNSVFPTPAATMDRQRAGLSDDDDEDSEPVMSTQRRTNGNSKLLSHKRAKQQQLDFSNARDPDSFDSPARLSSSAKTQSSGRVGIFGTQTRGRKHKRVVNISSSESEDEDELPSPAELMEKTRSRKEMKQSRRAEGDNRAKAGPSRATRSSQRPIVVESDEEADQDEDNTIVVSDGLRHAQIGESGDDDDDEEMPTTVGKQQRKRKRRQSIDSFISSSPPRAIGSDDDVTIIEKPRAQVDGADDSDDDVPVTPRRKLKRPRQMSRQEQEDLNEDLDFLGPSSDVEALERQPRSTQSRQRDARQAAMEKLKRKRAGQPQLVQIDEDEEEDDEAPLGVPDEEADELYEDDDEEPQITSSRQMFRATEDDDDFLEDDGHDTGIIGIPEGMPIELTRFGSMKAKELFIYAVEWMVQKKINPAFSMHDELYEWSFRKLNDEVKILAGSKFKSAAWTPDFTIALESRPTIAFGAIDRNSNEHWLRDKCDACNRTGHPATYEIQFQGKPYHPATLENVTSKGDDDDDSDSSTSEDEDDGDEPSYDYQGRTVPPENTIFYVGKFCMANAQTAHDLTHWKHHLYDVVLEWLKDNGYETDEAIVRREKLSERKRRKLANKITDRMEKDGQIKVFWEVFRQNIDTARSSKQGRFGGDSP